MTTEPRETDKVYVGGNISTERTTRAILSLIKSPIVGDLTKESTRRTIERLGPSGVIYPLLSGGEKNLVLLAREIWAGSSPLGGVDKDTRRKVMIIMWYFYLGELDFRNAADATYMSQLDFQRIFGKEKSDYPS